MPEMTPPPDARNLMYDNRPAESGTSIYVADCDVDALAMEGWSLVRPIEIEPVTPAKPEFEPMALEEDENDGR